MLNRYFQIKILLIMGMGMYACRAYRAHAIGEGSEIKIYGGTAVNDGRPEVPLIKIAGKAAYNTCKTNEGCDEVEYFLNSENKYNIATCTSSFVNYHPLDQSKPAQLFLATAAHCIASLGGSSEYRVFVQIAENLPANSSLADFQIQYKTKKYLMLKIDPGKFILHASYPSNLRNRGEEKLNNLLSISFYDLAIFPFIMQDSDEALALNDEENVALAADQVAEIASVVRGFDLYPLFSNPLNTQGQVWGWGKIGLISDEPSPGSIHDIQDNVANILYTKNPIRVDTVRHSDAGGMGKASGLLMGTDALLVGDSGAPLVVGNEIIGIGITCQIFSRGDHTGKGDVFTFSHICKDYERVYSNKEITNFFVDLHSPHALLLFEMGLLPSNARASLSNSIKTRLSDDPAFSRYGSGQLPFDQLVMDTDFEIVLSGDDFILDCTLAPCFSLEEGTQQNIISEAPEASEAITRLITQVIPVKNNKLPPQVFLSKDGIDCNAAYVSHGGGLYFMIPTHCLLDRENSENNLNSLDSLIYVSKLSDVDSGNVGIPISSNRADVPNILGFFSNSRASEVFRFKIKISDRIPEQLAVLDQKMNVKGKQHLCLSRADQVSEERECFLPYNTMGGDSGAIVFFAPKNATLTNFTAYCINVEFGNFANTCVKIEPILRSIDEGN